MLSPLPDGFAFELSESRMDQARRKFYHVQHRPLFAVEGDAELHRGAADLLRIPPGVEGFPLGSSSSRPTVGR